MKYFIGLLTIALILINLELPSIAQTTDTSDPCITKIYDLEGKLVTIKCNDGLSCDAFLYDTTNNNYVKASNRGICKACNCLPKL